MRTGGMLCRSQAATAVCVPGDARSMVVGRRADRTIAEDARTLHDVRYVRLGGDGAGAARVSSRQVAPPQPPPMPRRRGAPVAVTLPMVTKSPVETPARDTAAAKRTSATPTAAVAPGEQVLQVVVMKVAIHCQGCAGKVRKHISKMEGMYYS
uniref:HMA domain-containing protein n=1 Tax=Aegilops tauschii subsp. strangulata TaxID=200361 RepID=A0A452Z991_AEGTS